MAKITLKDKYGRVLAEVGEDDPVVTTGETATVNTKPSNRVVATKTGETGYVEEEVLETWTESTVQIPESFAGLESLMVPTRLRDQLFDIISVDEQEEYVEITAVHMFYRQRQNNTLWEPSETTRYSGASACRNILTNAMFDQGFAVASDSTAQIDGNRLDYENKNIVEAFLDPENGICAKWGLSLIRDNDVFYCLKDVGYDRGLVIQNRKNMLGVERSENIEDTITRVAPVARDASGDPIWLNYNGKKYVDSSHINDYPYPKLEIYNTDLRIGENGVTTDNVQAKLLEAAQKRFSEDEVDVPAVTMTIRFVSLGDTEEYAQYRDLDKVYLYDILHIKDTDRGYSYSAQVIGVEHNILTGILESVTIGTPKKWDGTRKIGSWQVPEFSGGKVRPGSIRAGSFETAAVRGNDIANSAIRASHMSSSADGHFRTIFAEELYISNTSEDGLLNTRFTVDEQGIEALVTKTGINSLGQSETLYGKLTVEAGKISQIVSNVGADGTVTSASIVAAINRTTGQGEVHIDADHVYINAGASNESNVVTTIGGKLEASDFNATNVAAKIAQASQITAQALLVRGVITCQDGISCVAVYANNNNITNPIMSASVSGNTLTLTKADGTVAATFSKATTQTGSWGSGVFTSTAYQNGVSVGSLTTSLTAGQASWSGKTVTIPIYATIGSGATAYNTGKTVSATYSGGGDYDAGWNACRNAMIESQWYWTGYTGTESKVMIQGVGERWVITPYQSANHYRYSVPDPR